MNKDREEEFNEWIENAYEVYNRSVAADISKYRKVTLLVPIPSEKQSVIDDEYIHARSNLSVAIDKLKKNENMTDAEYTAVLEEIQQYQTILMNKISNAGEKDVDK